MRDDVIANHDSLATLRRAFDEGAVRTVRICFGDHYGVLRGRHVAVERLLEDPDAPYGFCSAAFVWNRRSEISNATPFASFDTGYPDFYWRVDPATAVVCGWAPGEALALGTTSMPDGSPAFADPRHVLSRVLAASPSVAEPLVRLALQFQGPGDDTRWRPGSDDPWPTRVMQGLTTSGYRGLALQAVCRGAWCRLSLGEASALAAGDAGLVARAALEEIALLLGSEASFVPNPPGATGAGRLEIALELDGADPDLEGVRRRLADLCVLLRPTVNAYVPTPENAWPLVFGGWLRSTLASSEANPYLAIAAVLAAFGSRSRAQGDREMPSTLEEAAGRFAGAGWVHEWFEALFVDHAVALARAEVARDL
ncbi:MAG: hypothetical protein ACR2ND_05640 [Solirubrobacteraceae bacterium]